MQIALTILIILINFSIGILGIIFCNENMIVNAAVTLFLLLVLLPISFNLFDKLNYEKIH